MSPNLHRHSTRASTHNHRNTIILDNDTYESVRYTFEVEVLCYYNNYPFIHSNADVKHLSGDYIMHCIVWLEDDSAVWDIQINTRTNPD